MHTREAIIAAGCTRLRPVLLTAVTTILGLLPMVTGIALATVLTLVVVPTLYSLVYTTGRAAQRAVKSARRAYWAPFYRLTGTRPDEVEQL